jgi:hypothetical protein
MQNKFLATALMLLPFAIFGQSGELVRFRVVADSVSVAGINVVNLVNEKSAITDGAGNFTVLVKPDDLLVLQSSRFEYKRKLVDEDDFKNQPVIIKMIPKPVELDEVLVKKKSAPDDLIKRHTDHRDYTPAERKLYTATTGPVDILVNAISGRTKMLKKQLDVEMKERLLARLEIQYDDAFYTETLKIPAEYIKGFQHYVIEDAQFVSAMRAKNKTLMRLHISRLANTYNQLQAAKNN